MRSDECISGLCTLLCLVLSLLVVKYNLKFAVSSFILCITYSVCFYDGLYFHSEYGGSLIWIFLIIVSTTLHNIVLLFYLVISILR